MTDDVIHICATMRFPIGRKSVGSFFRAIREYNRGYTWTFPGIGSAGVKANLWKLGSYSCILHVAADFLFIHTPTFLPDVVAYDYHRRACVIIRAH